MTVEEFIHFSGPVRLRLGRWFPDAPFRSAIILLLKSGKRKFDNASLKEAVKEWAKDPIEALETNLYRRS